MRVIEVIVNAKGESRIETRGFAGAECQQATRALEAALGVVESEQLTTEFYQSLSAGAPIELQSDAALRTN